MKSITDVKIVVSPENNPLQYIKDFKEIEVLLIFFPSFAIDEFREEEDELVELFTSRIYSAGAYMLFFPDYYKATDILNCIWQTNINYQAASITTSFFNGRILYARGLPAAFTEFIPVGPTYSNVLIFPRISVHPELPNINTNITEEEVRDRLLTFSKE